jgi:DNA-directed RNA polymerase specialized sigma24 family protein
MDTGAEVAGEIREVDRGRPQRPDFEVLYREQRTMAVQLAWLLTHDHSAAEDIAHDAFEQLFNRFDGVTSPVAYLRKSVINGAYQQTRRLERERRRNRLVLTTQAETLDGPTGGVLDVVMGLPHKQRTVVVLRYWAGLQHSEIAEVMGLRTGSVRSLLTRATSRLRKELLP